MYDYPVVAKGSKLGIHSLRPKNSVNHIRHLKANGTRFPVVKAVDDIDWLIEVKAIDPEIVTIARLHRGPGQGNEGLNGVENVTNGDYSAFVEELFAPVVTKLNAQPALRSGVDYWEICNEPDPPGADGYRKLAEAMIACMNRAEQMGIKLAIFAWNAGTPEWDELQAAVNTGVFGRARRGGHIMTVHEGVFKHPTEGWIDPIDFLYGVRIPNAPVVPGTGALCFRYRYLYHLLEQRDEVIPLVVSEIVYGGGYAHDGGSASDTTARARWYDERARQDYYVLGHLPFTLGSNDGEEWSRRDYEFAYAELMAYMISVRNQANEAAPPDDDGGRGRPGDGDDDGDGNGGVTPPPPPTPQKYKVVVNLLPQDATLSEKIRVLTAVHAQRQGVHQSADDAKTLVLSGRDDSYVKVWAAERWREDIIAFFERDGVRVERHTL